MNQVNFSRECRVDPDWAAKNVIPLSLDVLEIREEGGQSRVNGIIPSNVMAIATDFEFQGQLVPITVTKSGDKFEVVEGNHRVQASIFLNDKHGETTSRFSTVRAYVKEFASEAEKMLYQVKQNNHLPAKSNAVADIAKVVSILDGDHGLQPEGFAKPIPMYHPEYPQEYEKSLDEWIKASFSFKPSDRKKIREMVTGKYENKKLQTFGNKAEAAKFFRESNDLGWIGKKVGDESNGWVMYAVNKASHVFPNIAGNGLKRKTEHSSDKVALCVYMSNLFGKTGRHVDDYRRKIVESVNKLNTSRLLTHKAKIVDKIFLLPQKLEGVENPDKLYEVSVTSSGKFTLNLPKKGW